MKQKKVPWTLGLLPSRLSLHPTRSVIRRKECWSTHSRLENKKEEEEAYLGAPLQVTLRPYLGPHCREKMPQTNSQDQILVLAFMCSGIQLLGPERVVVREVLQVLISPNIGEHPALS